MTAEGPPVRKLWELHYRKSRSKAHEWIVLVYPSEDQAQQAFRTLEGRYDIVEKKIVEKPK